MGDFVTRPYGARHKLFWKVLKQRWPHYSQVRLGKGVVGQCCEAFLWCREQPGEFYRSDGSEVYYFEVPETAARFAKLADTMWNVKRPNQAPDFHPVTITRRKGVSCCEMAEYADGLGRFVMSADHRTYAFERMEAAALFKLRWYGEEAHA
jgi:hypothetical protein